MVGVGDGHCGLAVLEDVADLVAVESGVDRHGNEAGVPDREQCLEILRPVAHHDGDAAARRQSEVVAKARSCCGHPFRERCPVGVHPFAVGQRRVAGTQEAVALHPNGQVHDAVPCGCSTTVGA